MTMHAMLSIAAARECSKLESPPIMAGIAAPPLKKWKQLGRGAANGLPSKSMTVVDMRPAAVAMSNFRPSSQHWHHSRSEKEAANHSIQGITQKLHGDYSSWKRKKNQMYKLNIEWLMLYDDGNVRVYSNHTALKRIAVPTHARTRRLPSPPSRSVAP